MLSSCCALAPPAGHQVSQRLAEEAKKRDRYEEMRQQLELDQEVRGSGNKAQACLKCMKSVCSFLTELSGPSLSDSLHTLPTLRLFQVMNTKVKCKVSDKMKETITELRSVSYRTIVFCASC